MLTVMIIIGWLGFAIATMGGFFAYFQREYPTKAKEEKTLKFLAFLYGLAGGPFFFIATIFCSEFFMHGWRLK